MSDDLTYKIRPAARLIHTIGSDLIGDSYAALVELVKNSYDADATKVDIVFKYTEIDNEQALIISIKDDGHGMDFDTVINKWLVPATNDKLKRKVSKNGSRTLQGRKGIGRFAASILGQEMTLSTVDANGEKSEAVIDWRIFKTDEFLENIELLIEKKETQEASGTDILIIAKDEKYEEIVIDENGDEKVIEKIDTKLSYWNRDTLNQLVSELRKLISPFNESIEDKFKINLSFKNSPFKDIDDNIKIETYPIIKYYDYRVSGTISDKGKANLLFENNVNPEVVQTEKIEKNLEISESSKFCGEVKIDFRVFDREPEAIENLINKGLINPVSKVLMGKREARNQLNEVYGVNIYKNSFRIRPYGNKGVDWLGLDKSRVQSFADRVSNNQIVGFVTIQSEEASGLEEKSARDGLKENEFYSGLVELSQKALSELEERRYGFRLKSKKSRGETSKIQDKINTLFSLTDVKSSIGKTLSEFKIDENAIDEIENILTKEEAKKAELKEEIEKTIAIYQGQATLGKIVNFILHEGRKPLQFFNSETKIMERYLKFYRAQPTEEDYERLVKSINGFKMNSKFISTLFKRISPLAKLKREKKSDFSVIRVINESLDVFKSSIEEANIKIDIVGDERVEIFGWSEDLYIALTNLIENSVYWLGISKTVEKKIVIEVIQNKDSVIIDYKDTGPGLTDLEIESGAIFEPGYSKKIEGTGLGLAIAGEASDRLNGELSARKSDNGVNFQIEISK
ncbi:MULTISPECIES: sensor histidine kinase [Leeuwenhoekiella]|jgi:signal transduction histidine kinase|uniref:histidine kinase n=3 Tax=Leeuwenhoekiella TaxID=283735 RepID=A3XL09_LEEBM|nr:MULTISPECIES: sensor histidine kinase [Leeuwenhoekiella]EAQ49766.1 Histidine Kinase [Leeuwenhoekiella blandensis MED217]MAO43308.1 histidine kinase [Leeuwenhoekiella sp.]HBT10422.1 histidine kinase [Leeuwenhoekiella sp.]HCW65511.1 histidine kinase [Leeuwenhoekiella sp.]|tara:strand:+ start:2475 stop:4703 length:2229 start_codon:yes stop_codon:yes gene_type:complete